jgi:hypothetical protein
MANIVTSESLSNLRSRDYADEEGINKISSLVNTQRLAELKNNQIDLIN